MKTETKLVGTSGLPEKSELNRLALLYLFEDSAVHSTPTSPELRAEIISSLFKAIQNTSAIQSYDALKKTVREISGLEELKGWLSSHEKEMRAKILSFSGDEQYFKDLCTLCFTFKTEKAFGSLERFQEKVTKLKEWLWMVKLLLQSTTPEKKRFLLKARIHDESGDAWDKDRVYYSLLLSVTLNVEHISFSLEELYRFSMAVRNHSWAATISAALQDVVIDPTTNTKLGETRTMRALIADMADKLALSNMFSVANRVSISNNQERKCVKEFTVLLGKITASKFTNEDAKKNVEKLIEFHHIEAYQEQMLEYFELLVAKREKYREEGI